MKLALLTCAACLVCFFIGWIIGKHRANREIMRLLETPVEQLRKNK